MEGSNRLKLIIVGLVLAALAIGYFILSRQSNPPVKSSTISLPTPSPSPSLVILNQTSPSPVPVAQTLPRTGFPLVLAVAISGSVMISGFFLRKFPD